MGGAGQNSSGGGRGAGDDVADVTDIAAVILAGGQARRMGGGDKPLLTLAGRTLLDHVLERIRPQVAAIALSANGDSSRFAAWGLPVLADTLPGQPGPLAGVLAGLRWASQTVPAARWLLSVPGDTPLLPGDLVARLQAALSPDAPVAMAASGGRLHPVVALWPLTLADALEASLRDGEGGVFRFAARFGVAQADFAASPDPFFNINTPEDLQACGRALDVR